MRWNRRCGCPPIEIGSQHYVSPATLSLSKNLESFRTPAHLLTENSHLLGAERVEVSCGPICNYSWGNNPDGNPVSNEVALEHIAALLPCVKQDLGEAELHYKAWFKERNLEL